MHLNNLFNESIVKKGSKYVVKAESGREMGTYDSKEKANKRLRQIEMFKHMAESINLTEAEADIKVEVPGVGVYTADTLSSNIIQSIEKLHQAAQEGDWEQVEYSLDPGKMGATLLVKSKALVQALKQNRMLEGEVINFPGTDAVKQAGKATVDAKYQRDARRQAAADKLKQAKDQAQQKFDKDSKKIRALKIKEPEIGKVSDKPLKSTKAKPADVKNMNLEKNKLIAKHLAKKAGSKIVQKAIPGVGAYLAGKEAYKDLKKGDYKRAMQGGLSALGYATALPLGAVLDPATGADGGKIGKFYHDISANGINPAFESVTEQFVEHLDSIEVDVLGEAGKDACYHKVKSRYKVWPSAYASGALVQCRKKGAKNWGNKSKKKSNENVEMDSKLDVNKLLTSLRNTKKTPNSDRLADAIEMRFMHNMTFKEIGEELNVGPQRAAMIVAKALRLLRWHAARNPN